MNPKHSIEWTLKASGLQYEKEFKFLPDRKFRFDFYVPELKLGIEYEGLMSAKSRHTTVTGYSNDSEKYNQAMLAGYKVLRYTALNVGQFGKDLEGICKIKN